MSLSLADAYYLKALGLYPAKLDLVLESLNYAIGYDSNHAGAHCLLGKLKMYQLEKFSEAEEHFEISLAGDLNYTETYYVYADLLILLGKYEKATNLIKYSYKVKAINISRLKHYEGLIAEMNGNFFRAKRYMTSAFRSSCREDERAFFQGELGRIDSKLEARKKPKKKPAGGV